MGPSQSLGSSQVSLLLVPVEFLFSVSLQKMAAWWDEVHSSSRLGLSPWPVVDLSHYPRGSEELF